MADEHTKTKMKNVDLARTHVTVVKECLVAATLANKKG